MPTAWTYRLLRRFHVRPGRDGLDSISERDLAARGFNGIRRWTRGVDTRLFRPWEVPSPDAARPVFLSVGRIAVEKNLEAFLGLDLPGTKAVVGDGPARAMLATLPDARFLGPLVGEDLARAYAGADVFVFLSLTDTFGIVLLEALASGLPIAAFPVTGPADVIGESGCGVLDWDLRAVLAALAIPKTRCRAYAETFTWRESARQFFGNIERGHQPWRGRRRRPSGKQAKALARRQRLDLGEGVKVERAASPAPSGSMAGAMPIRRIGGLKHPGLDRWRRGGCLGRLSRPVEACADDAEDVAVDDDAVDIALAEFGEGHPRLDWWPGRPVRWRRSRRRSRSSR